MRAIIAEGFGGYQDLKPADIPKPVLSDERVLVRMTAAGVTPLDHTILSGNFPMARAPLVLGNEGAGIVEEGGDDHVHGPLWCFGERSVQRMGRGEEGAFMLNSRQPR